MRLVPLVLCCLALLAGPAAAQVLGIRLADEKAEKKFKAHLVELDGARWIVCEAHSGIVWTDGRTLTYSPERNEVLVADPADPGHVPYELQGDKKVPERKGILAIQGKYIGEIRVLLPRQSLFGLSREYRKRLEEIELLRELRDAEEKGSGAWSGLHARILARYERLDEWLVRSPFESLPKKLQKSIEKERKLSKGEAVEARLERALGSVRSVPVPERLTRLSEEITGGAVTFGVAESEHVRLTYDTLGVEEAVALELLRFAERAIDGFRRDFVDPYLDEEFQDHIPDHVFCEFWVGPDAKRAHAAFYEQYYGLEWGNDKERRLAVRGQTKRRTEPPEFLDYGKREDHDLHGVVAHRLGHCLADLHFNQNVPGMVMDWLEEAVGYHVAFEYLGRNEETCYAFKAADDRYARPDSGDASVEGRIEILLGERYLYNQLALAEGRRIDSLAPMRLWSMGDADLAKGWSFFDYLMKREGKAAHQWLRAACALAREKQAAFVNPWREEHSGLLGLTPANVFDQLEERWRTYARGEQEVTGRTR